MAEILLVITGAVLGGIAVWVISRSRFQSILSRQVSDIQLACSQQFHEVESRAKSAEAITTELRQQLQQKESECIHLRNDLASEREVKVEATTKLDASQKSLEEQKKLIETMKKDLCDTFNALSSAALKSSSEDFLRLASEHLGKVLADTKGKLGEHQVALEGTIKPLHEVLKRYEVQIKEIEESRHKTFGTISEQIRNLSSMHEQLQKETNNLVTALRKPQVSGSWGELALKRAAELAGMIAFCDFYEQESITTATGRLRPDMTVRLPNGRVIVVDAKAPVAAFLAAIEASSDEEKKKAIGNYIVQVRGHMTALGSKTYWDQFPESPEIVVMYLPGESFFSSAIEHDRTLIEDGIAKKVILATPTTFIALLKAIAYGWQQEQVTKSAQEISRLGKDLYDRFSVMIDHFSKTGISMRKAVESFNEGVRSMESRLIPSIKRFKELGVSSPKEIPPIAEISQMPKSMDPLTLEFSDGEEEKLLK